MFKGILKSRAAVLASGFGVAASGGILVAQPVAPLYVSSSPVIGSGNIYLRNNSGNVKDWGAVGDGVADDTVAIQDAINGTGAAYLPPGRYKITSALTMPDNSRITGERTKSVIVKGAGYFGLIKAQGVTRISIEDLAFEGDYSGTNFPLNPLDQGCGVYFKGCKQIVVRGCSFRQFGNAGTFIGCGIQIDDDLNGYPVSEVLIDGNHLSDGGGNACDIQVAGRDIKVVNNFCISPNDRGVSVSGLGGRNEITGNTILNKLRKGMEIGYSGTETQGHSEVIVTGNNLKNCGWSGIYTSNAVKANMGRIVIANNVIADCGNNSTEQGGGPQWAGISFAGVAMPVLVQGNVISNSGTSAPAGTFPAGISLQNVDDSTVLDNAIDHSKGSGIMFIDCNRMSIKNNTLLDNGSGASQWSAQISVGTNDYNGAGTPPESIAIVANTMRSSCTIDGIVLSGWAGKDKLARVLIADNNFRGPGRDANTGKFFKLHRADVVGRIANNIVRDYPVGVYFEYNYANVDASKLNGELLLGYNSFESVGVGIDVGYFATTKYAFSVQNVFTDVTTPLANGGAWGWLKEAIAVAPNKEFYSTAAPANGTWAVGDKVINSAPAAGQPMGWTCVTAGTPGTWRAMPNL